MSTLLLTIPLLILGPPCPHYGMRECAGRGTCDTTDGTCTCREGFASFDCAVVLMCDPDATRLPCSGNGVCNKNLGCVCGPGYSGKLCEVDEYCPKDSLGRKCSGVGVCAAGTCLCPSHTHGVACEHGASNSRDTVGTPPVEELASDTPWYQPGR